MTVARTAASFGAGLLQRAVIGLLREATGSPAPVLGVESDPPTDVHGARPHRRRRHRRVERRHGAMLGDSAPSLQVRASKGVHLVVPRSAITGSRGLILRTATSVLFVIPWGGHWIIGTTDTDWRLDRAHPPPARADIDYLLDQVNQVLDRR